MPVFSRLLPSAAASYALQTVGALVFVPRQDETFYDFFGSLGFLTTNLASIYYPTLKARYWDGVATAAFPPLTSMAPRQLLLNAALIVWTSRLGYFLLSRALNNGGDSRFDEIKTSPARFSFAWLAQATWVFAVGLPVYMVNSLPPSATPALRSYDYLSFGLFASAWLFEIIADRQKTEWRRARDNKEHDEKFISSGLWSISRHPNYLGEICLWTGVWALSIPALRSPAWAIAGISPLLTFSLLRYVSGVPLLEEASDKKFAGDAKWEQYKRTVPIFFPWSSI